MLVYYLARSSLRHDGTFDKTPFGTLDWLAVWSIWQDRLFGMMVYLARGAIWQYGLALWAVLFYDGLFDIHVYCSIWHDGLISTKAYLARRSIWHVGLFRMMVFGMLVYLAWWYFACWSIWHDGIWHDGLSGTMNYVVGWSDSIYSFRLSVWFQVCLEPVYLAQYNDLQEVFTHSSLCN